MKYLSLTEAYRSYLDGKEAWLVPGTAKAKAQKEEHAISPMILLGCFQAWVNAVI